MFSKVFCFMFFLVLLYPSWCCDVQMLDYSGRKMTATGYNKITDDLPSKKGDPGTITWLCEQLENKHNVINLDISDNKIGNSGAKVLGKYFQEEGFLDQLECLNISFNHITESGITALAPLLLRQKFRYLVIYGNEGAASKEGINALASELLNTVNPHQCDSSNDEGYDTGDARIYSHKLRKVIWIPKGCLDKPEWKNRLHRNPKSHQKYYDKYGNYS